MSHSVLQNLKMSPHRTSSVNCPLPMQSNARAFPGDLTSPNTHAKRGCLRLPLLVSRLHAITASCVADRQQTGLCLHEGCVHPAAGLPSSSSATSDEWIPASKLIEGVVPTSADCYFLPPPPAPHSLLCVFDLINVLCLFDGSIDASLLLHLSPLSLSSLMLRSAGSQR